jgi:hypothetical protein
MKIDRQRVLKRNNPTYTKAEIDSPLSVGNGDFAFTVDVTGLQTFYHQYSKIPLCTMASWAWHENPFPDGINKEIKPEYLDTFGRDVPYYINAEGQEDVFNYLRQNPHRFNLARIGLHIGSDEITVPDDLTNVHQQLDLYSAMITSDFRLLGKDVMVTTGCHPDADMIYIKIKSELIKSGELGVDIQFPYAHCGISGGDFNKKSAHRTEVVKEERRELLFKRQLDSFHYYTHITSAEEITLATVEAHDFSIFAIEHDCLELHIHFSKNNKRILCTSMEEDILRHWHSFWDSVGFVDFGDCTNKKSPELERRVVLSQYLTAIQCSGFMPPQETGLTANSWFGKSHLEMHYWHSAWFSLWGKAELLEKSMKWYMDILPVARDTAKTQGYRGARWPKMVDQAGKDSPSSIGPLLVWQQPHPILYAELIYRANPRNEILRRYCALVQETAEFMMDFLYFDSVTQRYILGPPLIPAQENHEHTNVFNPVFELAYWLFALKVYRTWMERLNMKPLAQTDEIINAMAHPGAIGELYYTHENCKDMFERFNNDHPAMLCAYGFIPGLHIDKAIMRTTLDKVLACWEKATMWGWDYPVMAMTAARLGEAELAVECLLLDEPKNLYLKNGHNFQSPDLPLYLPGNGGLLLAVGMMLSGWDGCEETTPGFPKNNEWNVRYEGIDRYI